MQHPKDPFPSDDPLPRRTQRSGHQPGGEFSRPRSSPRPPSPLQPPPPPLPPGMPLPAPAAPPLPLVPPETHHAEAHADEARADELAGTHEDAHGEVGGGQVLFEAWEPPDGPADPWWDVSLPPEFDELPAGNVADLELVLPRAGGSGGAGGGGQRPPRRTAGAAWDGPRHARPGRAAQYERYGHPGRYGRGRGRWGGAFLALTGALALAGAVPLGILGVRTLTDRPAPTVTTAPMADGHPISAPASAPAGQPSQLSQGQTAVAPGTSASPSAAGSVGTSTGPSAGSSAGGTASGGAASGAKAATLAMSAGPGCRSLSGVVVFPFHAPAGDGWQPGSARQTGPCGSSFTYSLLANVRNDSGNWHDHYAWIFSTGRKVASCTLSFYIPPSAHATSSGFYWISTGSDNPENRMADFSIDQKASQGQWVTKGPLTFPGGTVLVELTDRGVGPEQDSVEAGVLQLRCV